MIAAHWSQDPPRPVDVVPGFPPAASEALLEGLAKDPTHRPLPTDLVRRLAAVPAGSWPVLPARTGGRAPSTVVVGRTALPPVKTSAPKRRRWPLVAAAAVVVLAATGFLLRPAGSPPLQVTGGSVTASPASGHCPRAQFELVALIRTNGSAGTVTAVWHGLDGKVGTPLTLRAADGNRTVRTVLTVTVTGARALESRAVLEVRSPSQMGISSAPIRYIC
jgi:hypothetical protein